MHRSRSIRGKKVRFTICELYLYRKEIDSVQLTANTLNTHSGTNMKLSKHSDKACIIILPGLHKLLHLVQGTIEIIWWIHEIHTQYHFLEKASHSLFLAMESHTGFFGRKTWNI